MNMLKRDLTQAAGKIAADNVVLRCGECMHFRSSAHPSMGAVCSSQGVKPYALAPNCYTPDVSQIKSFSQEAFLSMSMFVASCKPSQAKILMGMLKNQAQLGRHGLTFLQKVYFQVGNEDYVNAYFSGFVLGLGPNNKILIVGTQCFSNSRSPVVAQLDKGSVLTRDEFNVILSRLVKQGRLAPPKPRTQMYVPANIAEYEPPTIETAQELLEATAVPKSKKAKPKSVLEIRMD